MGKLYHVRVDSSIYEVEVEAIANVKGTSSLGTVPSYGAAASAPAAFMAPPAPSVVAPAPVASAAPAPAAAPSGVARTVQCAMPGTILDVRVSEGQSVTAGEVILVMEAMKMEVEVFSPCNGTVTGLAVSGGESVNANDVLCTIA